jgi:hypothetical protein
MVIGLNKTVAEKSTSASVRKEAIRRVFQSPPLNGVVAALRNFRLTGNNGLDSGISFDSPTHEQATRIHGDVEFRKAQAFEWYTRQRSRMM